MAKISFTVDDFSNGVNAYKSSRNIEDTELAQCQGFKIDPGVISVLGDMKADYAKPTSANANASIEDGYGLAAFSHDYTDAGALAATRYIVLMDGVTFDVYSDEFVDSGTDDDWVHEAITLGTEASGASFAGEVKPCFFIVDGAIRVSPGNFIAKDSAGDMAASSGNFAASTISGFHESKTAITDITDDIAAGDTLVINGQEMIALRVQATTLDVARNMTGLFPAATNNDDAINVVLEPRWRGIVQRRAFSEHTTIGTFTEWYSTYAYPRPPVLYHTDIDHDNVSSQYTYPFLVQFSGSGTLAVAGELAPCVQIGYYASTEEPDGLWGDAVINLYCTALYDDIKQESQPTKHATAITVAAAKEFAIYVAIHYSEDTTYRINKRVTGARIYYEDTTNDPGILYQLVEVDLEKGTKKANAEKYTPWLDQDSGEVVDSHAGGETATNRTTAVGGAFIFVEPPQDFTYEINAGFPSHVNTHARYKCATALNGRLFAGNIYQSGKAHGDRMIGSPTFKYDILPEYGDYVIDVTTGDGDQITALQGYSDRILQFKNRSLYIINVAGGLGEEYMESQHPNMGVANPSQVCLTEFGVAWVNAGGVFLYDGSEILDMATEKLQSTNTTERAKALNIDEDNIPLIGYYPSEKWLIVHPASNVSTDFEAEAWIHDFKSKTWSYTKEFTADVYHKTNMVVASDNELIFAAGTNSSNTPNFFKYGAPSSNVSATKLLLLTKVFDLGEPGTQKRLCSVYVTYSAAANTAIEADIIYTHLTGTAIDDLEEVNSGSTFYTEANGFLSTVADDGDGLGSIARTRTVELVPTSPINNAFTFQLKLHNPDAVYPYGADFKLYNLQFVYRAKGIR